MEGGHPKLLKSAEVGFALAEYSSGDDVDPVRLSHADECHAKFIEREARQATATTRLPATNRKRRQPAAIPATQPATAQRSTRSRRNDKSSN